ncbi:acyl carrier protein [Erythrobacter sp.]|uniref:acyl carrier protein n=1 Tax=Erythrobacter sp. TaxID=1042 RepID=UPI003C767B21
MLEFLRGILASKLSVEPQKIDIDAPIFETGISSLAHLNAIMEIEEKLNIELDGAELKMFYEGTIAQIADMLIKQ